MRQVKKTDNWRHVNELKGFPLWLERVKVHNTEGFNEIDIKFGAGVSVICGRNGSGKSTFLKIIYRILSKNSDFSKPLFDRINIENVSIEISHRNGSISSYSLNDENVFQPLEYFDPTDFSLLITNKINVDSNVSDWLEGVDPNQVLNENLDLVKSVTGKQYESVDVYEVDEVLENDQTLPYFIATLKNCEYSNESMGQGEHKLLLMLWKIFSLGRSSLFLLEEPEAFLCPKSQMEFMDFIAHVSSKEHILFLMSSHSEHVLSKASLNSSMLMQDRPSKGFSIVNPKHRFKYAKALGLSSPKTGCILVEDDFAEKVLNRILVRYDSYFLHTFFICVQNGESDIEKLLKHHHAHGGIDYLGIFDADFKGKINESDYIWPIYFLPGEDNLSPEKLVIKDIKQNQGQYAISLSVEEDVMIDAVNKEMDHHDFFMGLSEDLQKHITTIKEISIDLWIENNKLIVDEFIYVLENSRKKVLGKIEVIDSEFSISVGNGIKLKPHEKDNGLDFTKLVNQEKSGYVECLNGLPVFRISG